MHRFVVGIDVIIVVIRFAEQVVGRTGENVRDLDHLFKGGAGSADLPAADGRLLHAKLFGKFALDVYKRQAFSILYPKIF